MKRLLVNMKTKAFFPIVCLTLLACNPKQNSNDINPSDTVIVDITKPDSSAIIPDTIDIIKNEQLDDNYINNFSFKHIEIFEPRAYEESDYTKHMLRVMEPLFGLFQKGNKYELKRCKIIKNNIYNEECSEAPVMEPTLDVKGNCLYLFKGVNFVAKAVLDTVPSGYKVWVGQTKNFKFKGVDYQLKSEGRVLSKSGKGEEYFENIRDYKLYLISDNKAQCIVEMKYFADTMTEIRWIGDLDGDNKPDFIISSPDHYESNRIMLFLSSMAEGQNMVKLVSIMVDTYAC